MKANLKKSIMALKSVAKQEQLIKKIANLIKEGGLTLVCGNGGSAGDSQHLVGELVCKFKKVRKPYPAIALTTDTSVMTAIANDFSYDDVFTRQVQAFKNATTFIGISTSGTSINVLNAMKEAVKHGMIVVGLTGKNDKEMKKNGADYIIKVDSKETARIQEGHIFVIHSICELLENEGEE